MSPSFAILLGILIGFIAGAVAGLWLAGSKTKAEQRLREQGDLSSGAQIATLQRELDRARAEAEARGLQVRQLDAGLATQSTLAAERLNSLAALDQQSESLRQQLLAATQPKNVRRSRSASSPPPLKMSALTPSKSSNFSPTPRSS